jgi:hypothetical protein
MQNITGKVIVNDVSYVNHDIIVQDEKGQMEKQRVLEKKWIMDIMR